MKRFRAGNIKVWPSFHCHMPAHMWHVCAVNVNQLYVLTLIHSKSACVNYFMLTSDSFQLSLMFRQLGISPFNTAMLQHTNTPTNNDISATYMFWSSNSLPICWLMFFRTPTLEPIMSSCSSWDRSSDWRTSKIYAPMSQTATASMNSICSHRFDSSVPDICYINPLCST